MNNINFDINNPNIFYQDAEAFIKYTPYFTASQMQQNYNISNNDESLVDNIDALTFLHPKTKKIIMEADNKTSNLIECITRFIYDILSDKNTYNRLGFVASKFGFNVAADDIKEKALINHLALQTVKKISNIQHSILTIYNNNSNYDTCDKILKISICVLELIIQVRNSLLYEGKGDYMIPNIRMDEIKKMSVEKILSYVSDIYNKCGSNKEGLFNFISAFIKSCISRQDSDMMYYKLNMLVEILYSYSTAL